jgi:hypothetical protein
MSNIAIDTVRQLEDIALTLPQVSIDTQHAFHAGMYARTIMIPATVLLTGALIKIATLLIVSGDALVYMDGKAEELHGYNVFSASANRKQAFMALTDTYLTMVFPTEAKTVEEAEAQFTDEADKLMSRIGNNEITITED